jgi:uncharacterized protein YbaR (Trm112 family)
MGLRYAYSIRCAQEEVAMPVHPELLKILVCPDDKDPVEYVQLGKEEWLVCHTCGRRYPVRDDIPVMLIEEGDRYRDEALIRRPQG